MAKKSSFFKRHTLLITYILFFLFMLFFNCLTPLAADDFNYSFSWVDNSRISGIAQIIDSMVVHRSTTNGRVIVHGLVQFMLMFPKLIFNILNSLVAVFLLNLILKFSNPANSRSALFATVVSALMIFNFTPKFSEVFLWLTGSINYSWSICCLLLFVWPYTEAYLYGKPLKKLWAYLHIPFAFIAGSCAESFSPAAILIASCFCLLLLIQNHRISWHMIASLITAILGFLFLLYCPASAGRVSGFSVSVLANSIVRIISSVREHLLPLYVIYAVSLALSVLFKSDFKRIICSLIFVLGGAASLAAYSLAVYFVPRHMAFAVILTVLASIILMTQLIENGKQILPSICAAYLSVLFVFNFALGSVDIISGYSHALERNAAIEAAHTAGEKEITLESYISFTDYAVKFFLDQGPDYYANVGVGMYYGFDSVYGMPS